MCLCIDIGACLCSAGFQVVGGENSSRVDLGTIISSITPGGPADVNGCLKPGRPVFCRAFFSLAWVKHDEVCHLRGWSRCVFMFHPVEHDISGIFCGNFLNIGTNIHLDCGTS